MTLLLAAASQPAATTQTPFETEGRLTTLAEELEYLQRLAYHRPAVEYRQLSLSAGGRPVPMVVLGTGTGRPLILRASIHAGTEIAPREAAMIFVRQVAQSDDPLVTGLLAERRVYVITTASPDSRALNRRQNAAGIDLNRDTLAITQPETAAFVQLVRSTRPIAYLDAHENGTTTQPVEYHCCNHASTHPDLTTFAASAIVRIAEEALPTTSHRWYGLASPPSSSRVTLGLHGIPTMLTETGNRPLADRVQWQLALAWAWLRDVAEHAPAYEAASDAALAWMAGQVTQGPAEWDLDGRNTTPGQAATTGTTIQASAYTLTSQQHTTHSQLLGAHGIVVSADHQVDLAQEGAAVAVQLLDPASGQKITSGTRVN